MGRIWRACFLLIVLISLTTAQREERDPCDDHKIIEDPRRSPSYLSNPSERRLCDIRLSMGWYRFQINGSDADMPTECVEVMRCGTLAPLWLSLPPDGLPLPGSKVKASACVTLTSRNTSPDCCGFRFPVEIKNCLNYFVYKLRSTGGCDLAYCAQVPTTLCLNNQIYVRHLDRCIEYDIVFSKPQVSVSQQNGSTLISCTFDIKNTLIALTLPSFQVDWYKGDGRSTNIIKSTLTRNTSVTLILGNEVFPGDTVVCGVQSIHEKVEQQSEPYFLGIKVVPNKIRIHENRLTGNVSIISSIPLTCIKGESCVVSVVFTLKPIITKDKPAPDLKLNTCVVHFRESNLCNGTVCGEQFLQYRMLPNLFDLPKYKTVLHGEIITNNGLLRRQKHIKARVDLIDFPSASCYILSGIHIISLTGSIHKVLRRGTFILVRTYDAVLQVQVRITTCRNGNSLCVCGVAVRYIDSLIVIDGCAKFQTEAAYVIRYNSVDNERQGMHIWKGRNGKLISIRLKNITQIRVDVTEEGLSVSILVSGFYTSLTEGLCGIWKKYRRRKSFATKRFSKLLFMPELWRIQQGQSYFDKHTDLDIFSYDVKQLECDCTKSTFIVTCPRTTSKSPAQSLVSLEDITEISWNRTVDIISMNLTSNTGYVFDGDMDTEDISDKSEPQVGFHTASLVCDNVLYNSMISQQCSKLFKKHISNFLDICIDLALHRDNATWIPIILRLLENTCDMHIITESFQFGSHINDRNNISVVEIKNLFLCPEKCHGNGVCAAEGCACFVGFSGVECLKKAESSTDDPRVTAPIGESTNVDHTVPTVFPTPVFNVTTESVFESTSDLNNVQLSTDGYISDTSSDFDHQPSTGMSDDVTDTIASSTIPSTSSVELTTSHVYNTTTNRTTTTDIMTTAITTKTSTTKNYKTLVTTLATTGTTTFYTPSRKLTTENDVISSSQTYTFEQTTVNPEDHLMFISCDKRYSNCGYVYLSVPSYNEQFAVSCKVFPMKYKDRRWMERGGLSSGNLRYISNTLIECMLPIDQNEMEELHPVYKVEIMSSAGSVLAGTLFAIIDSTCQKCARWDGCTLKNDTCFINGRCYLHDDVNPRNVCIICDPQTTTSQWTINKENLPPVLYPKPKAMTVIDGDNVTVAFNVTDPEGTNVEVKVNNTSIQRRKHGQEVVWKTRVVSLGKNGSANYFLFTLTDECGGKTSFVLKVFVLKCGCLNNGTCVKREVTSNSPSVMKCNCAEPYTGRFCETNQDSCSNGPCYPGVACKSMGLSYKCGPCPLGTVGNGQKCSTTCEAKPCFKGVNCSDIFYPERGFLCGPCPRYFTGNGTLCVRNAVLACREDVCSKLARCEEIDIYPGYRCGPCPNGYLGNGTFCTPYCKRPCGKGGVCTSPDKCTCHPGFTGTICNRAVCKPKCKNRGRCIGNNTCSCTYWYTGSRCERDVCHPKCRNGGTCTKRNMCVCREGFHGSRCQRETCSITCLNGGKCYGSNRCKCLPGYSGRFCESPLCTPKCINRGECVRPGICYCPFGFYGPTCERSFCYPPCMNGGVCRPNNVCKCPPTNYGRYCQHAICLTDCQNGGKCVSSNKCVCRSGWTGTYCQTPKCNLGCRNGGACFQPNQCACKRGFWGPNCQYALCWPRCLYGGRCVYPNYCKCRYRYGGSYCQVRRY